MKKKNPWNLVQAIGVACESNYVPVDEIIGGLPTEDHGVQEIIKQDIIDHLSEEARFLYNTILEPPATILSGKRKLFSVELFMSYASQALHRPPRYIRRYLGELRELMTI